MLQFIKEIDPRRNPLSSLYFVLILFGIPYNLFNNSGYDGNTVWNIGDWLISYEGGFVRRGLPGSIIYTISSRLSVPPIHLIWLFSCLFYLLLAILLWKLCSKKVSSTLLLSPLILLGPIADNYIVRKDVMLLTLFAISLASFRFLQSKDSPRLIGLSVINISSTMAILSHESYGFWALPALAASIYFANDNKKKNSRLRSLRKAILTFICLSPSIAAFIFCLLFKGSELQAMTIHESWKELAELIPSKIALFQSTPDGAIGSIGWTTIKGLSMSISTLRSFSLGLWVPACWMLTIYICFQLFVGDKGFKDAELKRQIAFFQFLTLSPLFLLGWDFGRWIFIWITSSVLLYSFSPVSSKPNIFFIYRMDTLNHLLLKLFPGISLEGNRRRLMLFFGIPHCCWTVGRFLTSTPIGYSVKLSIAFFTALTHLI